VIVQEGEVIVRHAGALGSGPLRVDANATLSFDIHTLGVTVPAVTLDPAGRIDLGYGRVTVAAAGADKEAIRKSLIKGRGDGSWNGVTGWTSGASLDRTPFGLGYIVNGDDSVTVGFAANGDTDLDGVIDILDVTNIVASNTFNSGSPASWMEGDFNYDGQVDILDISAFASANFYNRGSYRPLPMAAGLGGTASGSGGGNATSATRTSEDAAFAALFASAVPSSERTTAKKRAFATI